MNDLVVPARLSWEAWTQRVREVGTLRKRLNWYVGDLLRFGEEQFGEKASQFINELGYSEGALSNFRYVSGRFPPDERSYELPWSFYQACASFPKREREKLISQGLSGQINRSGVRALAAATQNGASNGVKIVPEGSQVAKNGIPEGVEVAERDLAVAYVAVGKLVERRERGKLTLAALDELIEKAMALRERLKPREIVR